MSSIFDKLKRILYEKFSFHYDQIQYETKLELELGIDSREMFELLGELEQSFNFNIDSNEIDYLLKNDKILTIKDLVSYIESKNGSK
jgi:acyl carrier protein